MSLVHEEAQLVRIYKTHIQKVRCSTAQLNDRACFLIVDDRGKQLAAWIGGQSTQVDRAMAVNLGEAMTRKEYHKPTATASIPVIEQNAPSSRVPQFVCDAFGITKAEYTARVGSISSRGPQNDTLRLYAIIDDEAANMRMQVIQECAPSSKGTIAKLYGHHFTNDQFYVVECGQEEVWLWYGASTARTKQKESIKIANELAARLKQEPGAKAMLVRARMEPTLFLEHFKDVGETFSATQAQAVEVDVRRALTGEIQRMTSSLMGTLGMVSGAIGDVSRAGLKMNFATDESGLLLVWRIMANSRTLQPVEPQHLGILMDTDAYAVLYTCKGGARSILYLWLGRNCPPATRAALALQARDIIANQRLQGSVDQLGLEQGRESPLLMSIFDQKANPMVILNSANATSPVRIIEFGVNDLNLAGDVGGGYEKSLDYIRSYGLHPQKVYVVTHVTQGSCSVWLRVGVNADVASVRLARRAAEFAAIFITMDEPQPTRITSSIVEIEHGSETPELLRALKLTSRSITNATYGSLTRPRRIFEVSDTRRSVGAMFVEEIGVGGVYTQLDMKDNACYILDTGRSNIFIWTGPDAVYKCFALAVRICKSYIASSSESFRSISGCEIVVIDSATEPPEFIGCFREWDASMQRAPSRNSIFRVDQVDADEAQDEKYDDLGQIRVEKTKIRYTDTQEFAERKSAKDRKKAEEEEKKRQATIPNYKITKNKKTQPAQHRNPSDRNTSSAGQKSSSSSWFNFGFSFFCMSICTSEEDDDSELQIVKRRAGKKRLGLGLIAGTVCVCLIVGLRTYKHAQKGHGWK